MSANASLHQLGSETPVVDYLQGGEHDTQLTFFKGESDPYAQFATNWIRLNFQQQNMQDGAVETSTYAEMQRAGDMLCHAFLVITAPPVANVTAGAIKTDGTDIGASKRVFVHGLKQDSHHLQTSQSYSMKTGTSLATAGTTILIADTTGSLLDLVSIGDTLHLVSTDATAAAANVTTHDLVLTAVTNDSTDTTFTFDNVTLAATIPAADATITFVAASKQSLGNNEASVFMHMKSNEKMASQHTRPNGPSLQQVPTATGLSTQDPILDQDGIHAHYGNYAPCTLVKELEVVIGTNPISKVTGLVMQANCELWTASDRLPRRAVNKSSDPSEKGSWSLQQSTWCLPVPFWFNQGGYHSSLALCALSFHSIRFNLTLHPYTRSIVNGSRGDFSGHEINVGTAAGTYVANGQLTTMTSSPSLAAGDSALHISGSSSSLVVPATTLKGSHFKFYMLLELIYLSDDERDTYTDMTDEILITQFQYASNQTLAADGKSVEMPLRFNHPVSQVVIAGQLQSNVNDNRHGEYEGPTQPLSVTDARPEGIKTHWLNTMKITFNNNDRTAAQPAWFFNETVPSVNAERVPDNHFYLYSFGLSSPNGSGQFAGGADFSRLDNAFAVITANNHVFSDQSHLGGLDGADTSSGPDSITGGQKIVVSAFGVSANVAKFENGLLGVCFL